MIAFLISIGHAAAASGDAARSRLGHWLEQHGMLTDRTIHQWVSADGRVSIRWAGHGPADLGGVSPSAERRGGFALICGRPVRWIGGEADGRAALDAGGYLSDPADWSAQLDGRYCVIRADDRLVHIRTDAGLPVYSSRQNDTVSISNMPALVTAPGAQARPRALAALLACGYGITGEPLRAGVDRLAVGSLHTYERDASVEVTPQQPSWADILTTEPDYKEAARMFVSLAAAYADWLGRPLQFGLTGGRDSRLMAAALRAAGLGPATYTMAYSGQVNYPETGDVRIARQLAATLGWAHQVDLISETAPVYTNLPAVMRILALTSPQTTSLADFQDVTVLEPWPGPPRILLDGVGGEIGRGAWAAYLGGDYPTGDTADAITDATLTKIVPRSPLPLVSADGLALVRDWLREHVGDLLDSGVPLRDIPEVLHLERQIHWHGPNLANRWHREDAFSMYLSPMLWPHMVGNGNGGERAGEFQRELLTLLGPDLAEIPYESGQATWLYDNAIGRTLTTETRLSHAIPVEPIGAILEAARTAAADPHHPAWAVLDRKRVTDLLGFSPDRFRGVERYQLWSLATALNTADPARSPV
ncbi:hypothetical protein ACIBMZ_29220 [Micromonospora sp. NPDC049900]|uniref:hypothetical protein n=1 Tax=Micromonospora sp. NPDC049900 TaxID=3364275 RepID=UPI00379E6A82